MNNEKILAEENISESEEHIHTHTHTHTHNHNHTQTKAVLNRMSRLIGHLQATKKMIESGRDCSEVLTQLSAVDSAIKAVSRLILKDHMEHCIIDAVQNGDEESVKELSHAIEQFIK